MDVESRCRARCLWVLTALFALRVVAQPAALVVEHPLLPRFEAWHSATVPYPLLVGSQIGLLGLMALTAWRFGTGRVTPQRRVARLALWGGAVYAGAMLARLFLGFTLLSESRWFASWLPTLFHLVLASFLLCVGDYHRRHTGPAAVDRERSRGPRQP